LKAQITVLLVMASERCRPLLGLLEACGIAALVARDCEEARRILETGPMIQAVFIETALPDGDWCSVLQEVVRSRVSVAVVVCVRVADERLWCDVLDRGGYDLLIEPYTREEVQSVMEGAARLRRRSQAGAG